MPLQNEINSVIQNRLKALKMTNAKFAELIGISAQYTGQLFKGKRRWNIDMLEKAFNALGIKVTYKTKRALK
jgi:transcriptional regulator with XRE-family HTH domain